VSAPRVGGPVLVRLTAERPLGPFAFVALEDYARELTLARAASARLAPGAPPGLELLLEAPEVPPEGDVLEDIQAFARELAERQDLGLGWS